MAEKDKKLQDELRASTIGRWLGNAGDAIWNMLPAIPEESYRTPPYVPPIGDGTNALMKRSLDGRVYSSAGVPVGLEPYMNMPVIRMAPQVQSAPAVVVPERVYTEGQMVQSANKSMPAEFVPVQPQVAATQQSVAMPYEPSQALRITPQTPTAQPWVQRPMTNCENGQCVDGMPYTSGMSRTAIADANRFGMNGVQTMGDLDAQTYFNAPILQRAQQMNQLQDAAQLRAISESPDFASLVETITKQNGGNRAEAQVLALGRLGGEGLVYRTIANNFSNAQTQGADRANNRAAFLNQDASFEAAGTPRILQQPDANNTQLQIDGNTYNIPTPAGGNTPINLATIAQALGQTTGTTVANATKAQAAQAKQIEAFFDNLLKTRREDRLSTPDEPSARSAGKTPERLELENEKLRAQIAEINARAAKQQGGSAGTSSGVVSIE